MTLPSPVTALRVAVRDARRRSRSRHPGAVQRRYLAGRASEIESAADGLLANGDFSPA